MCMAIPSKVISVSGPMARIDSFGVERDVSLMLMEEEVSVGDYVIVMAGGFVSEKIPADIAEESLAYLSENVLNIPVFAEEGR